MPMSFTKRFSTLVALLWLPVSAWFLRPTTFDLCLVRWDPDQKIFIASDSSNHAYSSGDGKNWIPYTGSIANGVQNINEEKFPASVTRSGYSLAPIRIYIPGYNLDANQIKHNNVVVWNPVADTVNKIVPDLKFLSNTPDRVVAIGSITLSRYTTHSDVFIISSADDVTWDTCRIGMETSFDTGFWTGKMHVIISGDATGISRDEKKWNFTFDYVASSTNYLYSGQTCYKKKIAGKTIIKSIGIYSSGWGTDRSDPILSMISLTDTSLSQITGNPDYGFVMQDAVCFPSFSIVVGRGTSAPFYKFKSTGISPLSKVFGGFAEGVKSICWNGSQYVVVGPNGLIAISTDGINWERDIPVYHDTILSGTQNDACFGVSGHITIQGAVIANELIVMPGTSFDMKPSSSISCQLLDANGTPQDSITFSPFDKTAAFSGLKVNKGTVSYARINGVPDNSVSVTITGSFKFSNCRFGTGQNDAPVMNINDGIALITNSIVNGKSATNCQTGSSFSYQNTLFTDSTRFTTNGVQNNYPSLGNLRNCTIAHGCIMSAYTQYGINSTGITSTNCAFMDDLNSVKTDSTNHVYFAHCLSGESLFENPEAGNFHLRKNSPAIDSGIIATGDTISTDLDGKKRVFGRTIDIGAYEYGSFSTVEHRTNDLKPAEPIIRFDGTTLVVTVASPQRISRISIFDAQGRVVNNRFDALPATTYHVPLSRLGHGFYYIHIETGLKSATYRICNIF
jgi:hypothetical protein